jgi:hypothetical protein
MKTSELREHITQHHQNKSSLPYWSDSSRSSQSPPILDALDISHSNNSWDEWFDNAHNQSNFQSTGREHYESVDFPATAVTQEPSQMTMTSNKNLSPPQHILPDLSFGLQSQEFETINAHSRNLSEFNCPTASNHRLLLGTLEDNRMSHGWNLNYGEPLENPNFLQTSQTQASLPGFSALSMTTNPILDPTQSLLMTGSTLPMMQFGGTGLPSTSQINDLKTEPVTMLNNASPLCIPSNHHQPIRHLRSLAIQPNSIVAYSAHAIQGRAETQGKIRNTASIQDRRASGKKCTQEESMSMAEDIYGVSDPENNLPKKRQRSGLYGSRTDFSDYRSASQSFFNIEPSQEISTEPSSQNKPREAPNFQCPTCQRTYKTEGQLT